MEYDLTIAICSYNPDTRTLTSLLSAVEKIIDFSSDLRIQVILVDNNSQPPLIELPCVEKFTQKSKSFSYAVEKQQGLAYARCCAIDLADAPVVVFLDDDNEPETNYCQILHRYFSRFLKVGVWFPGTIRVRYIDSVSSWFQQHPEVFQEHFSEFGYCNKIQEWSEYWGPGTGFAIRIEILKEYARLVRSGILTMTGRCGEKPSSCEDGQIVWLAIKMGYSAGMIPELVCNHLIIAKKANIAYLKKIVFAVRSSFRIAFLEVFPDKKSEYSLSNLAYTLYEMLQTVFVYSKLRFKNSYMDAEYYLAHKLGELYVLLAINHFNFIGLYTWLCKFLKMI